MILASALFIIISLICEMFLRVRWVSNLVLRLGFKVKSSSTLADTEDSLVFHTVFCPGDGMIFFKHNTIKWNIPLPLVKIVWIQKCTIFWCRSICVVATDICSCIDSLNLSIMFLVLLGIF